MIIANYESDWQNLSNEHEEISQLLEEMLDAYASGQLNYLSYAVIGTFGVGKTQFLYHISRRSREKGMLPFYVVAEDLFREVISREEKTVYTPGDIFKLVEEKVGALKRALIEKNTAEVVRILDPRGKIQNDSPKILQEILRESEKLDVQNARVVLLVDELEGQYGVLRDKTQTKDRSPLRDWLESKSYLKFLAFAPAGIYELGGADRDRVKRIVLPAVDTDYIRETLLADAGLSNACWWVSRGKARALFKAFQVLSKLKNSIDSAEASKVIKQELDYVGQAPTQVPPAVLSAIEPSKIPFLLNLSPIEGENKKRYVIDISKLQTGQLADKLIDAFGVNKDNAILISSYFKKTVKTLSDKNNVAYVNNEELSDLLCLVLDHLLEYEHSSPEVLGSLGEILNLYERVSKEKAGLFGIIGTLFELKETNQQFPFKISEIRKVFPFPTMNPIVKNYLPEEMRKKWIGKGIPIWSWTEDNNSFIFFACDKDFVSYSEKDEFLSLSLPDCKSVLALFPTGEMPTEKKPVLDWLEQTNKFKMAELPPLLTDFLLSLSGETRGERSEDINQLLSSLNLNQDILLSRKIEIYTQALKEIKESLVLRPQVFCKDPLPDTEDVWGKGQMDREVAVLGISLPFLDIRLHQKELLAEIRDLFHSGRESKGTGDLNPLMPRVGYIALCDDLFPRYGRKKELKDSEPLGRLSGYWRDNERASLVNLARILSREQYLKLSSEENMNRLLDALWKSVRNDFESDGFEELIQNYDMEFNPSIDECQKLEQRVITGFGMTGINFGDKEKIVKAKDSLNRLAQIAHEVLSDNGADSQYLRCVLNSFMSAIYERFETDIISLSSSVASTRKALDELHKVSEDLGKNYWEYRRATRFIHLSEDDLKKVIIEQTNIGSNLTVHELETVSKERKTYLESISTSLGTLKNKIDSLESLFLLR